MPEITIQGRTFAVDEEGFLQKPDLWDDEVAKLFATTEGVADMTPEHWAVVRMIREHYLEHGNAPMVRLLCQRTGINLGLLIVPESGCYAALGRLFRNPIEGGGD